MQYTKMVHVLHDTAQKTVFGHRHTRGSFLSLELSLVEPREEPEYETSWVINAVVHRLPALQTQNGVYSGQGRLALTLAIHSWFSVFSRWQKRTLCTEVAKLCSHTNSLTISAWAITPLSVSPPTLINFSLVLTSLTWERYQALLAFPNCKWRKAGRGLGTRLTFDILNPQKNTQPQMRTTIGLCNPVRQPECRHHSCKLPSSLKALLAQQVYSLFTLAWNGYEPVHGMVLKNGSASV